MSERIDDILAGIDTGLAGVSLDSDLGRSVETSVWADLAASVDQGWRTQDEADQAFAEWRGRFRPVGTVAVSQTAGMPTQQISDSKRRMRRT